MSIRFRPVMTAACHLSDLAGSTPLDDFPIADPRPYVPHWLAIDYRRGQWLGELLNRQGTTMHWLIYLVLGFIALILLMQYLAVRQARRSEGRPAPDTAALDGPAHADRRRLYYFYASHCGLCRAMAPLVDKLSESHRNLIKVNVAEAPETARPVSSWSRTA